MTRRIFSMSAAVFFAAACAAKPEPIPLSADQGNLGALVGSWSGEYSSDVTGRSGSIVFKLSAGKDTAFGDVVMVPRASAAMQGVPDRPQSNTTPQSSEVLTIRFARVEGGAVSGTLNAYIDPNCGCMVQTTFVGRLTDQNTIDGTFTTSGSGLPGQQSGRWKVKRQ